MWISCLGAEPRERRRYRHVRAPVVLVPSRRHDEQCLLPFLDVDVSVSPVPIRVPDLVVHDFQNTCIVTVYRYRREHTRWSAIRFSSVACAFNGNGQHLDTCPSWEGKRKKGERRSINSITSVIVVNERFSQPDQFYWFPVDMQCLGRVLGARNFQATFFAPHMTAYEIGCSFSKHRVRARVS